MCASNISRNGFAVQTDGRMSYKDMTMGFAFRECVHLLNSEWFESSNYCGQRLALIVAPDFRSQSRSPNKEYRPPLKAIQSRGQCKWQCLHLSINFHAWDSQSRYAFYPARYDRKKTFLCVVRAKKNSVGKCSLHLTQNSTISSLDKVFSRRDISDMHTIYTWR